MDPTFGGGRISRSTAEWSSHIREKELVPSMIVATIKSLRVGLPRNIENRNFPGQTHLNWSTGFYKESCSDPIWLGQVNLAGDGQADLENHGGPEKAVNVYPIEHYPYWTSAYGNQTFQPGSFGENFTIEGLLEPDVCIGDIFEVGQALVQISQPRQPCWKLARYWGIKDLAVKVQETGRTGWYFRVLKEGLIRVGDQIILNERHTQQWTVSIANRIMHHDTQDRQAAQALADCIDLSARWRDKLKRRALTGAPENASSRLVGPN